ncbi:MAG: DNA alkylation repair protein [Bacteroidaceae bacterium]|nr:DNA alkylation repair protein [Bacteroidaceae bacterium]
MTAHEIILRLEALRDDGQRLGLMRFFKTGPGQYGEGDEFLGLKVPQTREVVRAVERETPLSEVPALLASPWHEVRLCGLLLMVAKFERLATKRLENDAEAARQRDEILTLYLRNAERANNWDLVDMSAPRILGHWLLLPTWLGGKELGQHRAYKLRTLVALAESNCLWRQRMSIVCTWWTSQAGDASWCLRYADMLVEHPHDLMHKAVGWMLREMGKRVSTDLLRDFLRKHVHQMPRTALRYAIEKLSPDERRYWMTL